MTNQLITCLDEILNILATTNDNLNIKDHKLFSLSANKIETPAGDILPLLLQHTSKLSPQFIEISLVKNFIKHLKQEKALIRLNHLGFCYKVLSKEADSGRIVKLVSATNYQLYQEPSNDQGTWFFIGNTVNWEDPMIELIPVESTTDKWADYWLPHVQIDIDTTLSESQIKKYVKQFFGDSVIPFSIRIADVVYIVRNRLGAIDGVNITLDLATNSRNVKFQRQGILKLVK